jgi:aminoglycoside 6'-N-acetyltransferase I
MQDPAPRNNPAGFAVRPYRDRDLEEWLRLRRALWPELSAPAVDQPEDAAVWLRRPDAAVFVAERPTGGLAGFVEVGERVYADGCDTSPVAYLEGWFVDPDLRKSGMGAALVRAAEAWARERGYKEFASDALLDNTTSHAAHLALGFTEVERAIRYRKPL